MKGRSHWKLFVYVGSQRDHKTQWSGFMVIRIGLFVVCEGQRELLEQLSGVAGSRTVHGDLPSCKIWSSYRNVAEDLNLQSCCSVFWHHIICYMTLNNLHTEAATPHVLAINWTWSGSVMQQNSGLSFGLCTGWNVCVEGCAVGCVLGKMCVLKGVLWAVYWVKFVCWRLCCGLCIWWNVYVERCAVGCVLGEMCVLKGVLWAVYWVICVCWRWKFMLISLFPSNMCQRVPDLFPGTYAAVAWYWTATPSCAEVKETV